MTTELGKKLNVILVVVDQNDQMSDISDLLGTTKLSGGLETDLLVTVVGYDD